MIIKKRKFNKPNPKFSLRKRRKRKTKESNQTIFFSIFLAIIVLAAISFLVFSNWQINKKRSELILKAENLKKEIRILEEKKEELSAKISQTQKESYLEKEARERFNLKKPGEETVVILSPEEKKEEKKVEEKKNFFENWWDKIKSKF